MPVPEHFIQNLLEEYSPAKNAPVKADVKKALQANMPPDNLVLLNVLPYEVDVYWAWLVPELRADMHVAMDDSKKVATIAAGSAGKPSSIWLGGCQGQMFYVSAADAGGKNQSLSFVYPGELALAVVTQNVSKTERLQVELIAEDSIKVLLSDV